MRALLLAAACAALLSGPAQAWTLEGTSVLLKGTQINVTSLDLQGYRAIIKLLPEFRPRVPSWPAVNEVVAEEWGSKMQLGQVTIEQGSDGIGRRMEAILQREGYYDSKKPLLQ